MIPYGRCFIVGILTVLFVGTSSFHIQEKSKDDWKALINFTPHAATPPVMELKTWLDTLTCLFCCPDTKQYGEQCVNHDECVDFRMICNSICQCDQFHDWTKLDAYVSECVLNSQRLREFLSSQHETQPSFEDELSNEAHNLFVYLGLSGIVAISIGVLFTLACVVFVFTNDLRQHAAQMKG